LGGYRHYLVTRLAIVSLARYNLVGMDKNYDHKQAEVEWYDFWEKSGFFKANPKSSKKPYSLLMPPPNLTGDLHLGHAMQHAFLDAIARFKRLQGFDVLLLPGVDHAGILFEGTLNRILDREGLSKQKLGRDKWLERAWKFRDEIYKSFRKSWSVMGISADWSREVFTLEPKVQKAVFEEFKTFWEKDLLYKGTYIVQWCPGCGTAIEDIEMEYTDRKERLFYVKYLIPKVGDYIIVATTRPETIFADVAIAIHPNHPKYKKFVGENAQNPFTKKLIPIIEDRRVKKDFGTGALKITPGHDLLDYEIGKDNNLEILHAIGKDGKLTVLAGDLSGLDTNIAREKSTELLNSLGVLEKIEDYSHSVPICERCKSVVEPLISDEWFVRMTSLAQDSLKIIKHINFLPKSYLKIITDWIANLHDWSISRSLWWGHRIPVWYCGKEKGLAKPLGFYAGIIPQLFSGKTKTYRLKDHSYKPGVKVAFHKSGTQEIFGFGEIVNVEVTTVGKLPLNDPTHGAVYKNREELIAALEKHNKFKVSEGTTAFIYEYKFTPIKNSIKGCGEIVVSKDAPTSCPRCGNKNLVQDEQVLDTWFSSGLWPISTLGWPKKDTEFKRYFPWDFCLTAPEIKYLWIARMIMLSKFFVNDIPFKNMFFHGMLRDLQGRKFSKSLGNGVDPNELRNSWGTDSTRMALYTYCIPGRDGHVSKETMDKRCKNFRNFSTKLINLSRFIIDLKPKKYSRKITNTNYNDRWIKEELVKTARLVTKHMEKFELHLASYEIYDFIWHRFADKYIEHSKTRREETQALLEIVFEDSLKLLHPFMPFITEELWQKLPNKSGKSIMTTTWPDIVNN